MTSSKLDQNEETAFNSPIPIFHYFKNLIFGDKNPSIFQLIMIYFNLMVWLIFFIWHILSYYAIAYREIILSEKKVNIEIMILNRGSELGYDPALFLDNLLNFHRLSIVCWILVLVSIIFMWRKKLVFVYFLFGSIIFYYISMIYFLGTTYYFEDTTLLDKISIPVMLLNSIFLFMLIKNEDHSGEKFFGIEETE